ncbi:MAG TPA: RNA 2',3'-cyclic phosphodiesterase [Actinomycetota bacterium]|nr:RNA 2',3'-cyclic phosphodiesterase [Actinomycetota bacterium]
MARDRASRPEAKPLRLFAAVEIPQEIRAGLAEAVRPVRERFPKARWVPINNQHVTVKFLGATYPRLVEWVTGSISTVAGRHAPFPTRVKGLGAFPSGRKARVLWAGLDDGDGRLERLAAALDEALAREFPPEKRAFTAHLTVARFDPPVGLEPLEVAFASEPFEIDRIVLFRSHLRRPVPVYEPLGIYPLGSARDPRPA